MSLKAFSNTHTPTNTQYRNIHTITTTTELVKICTCGILPIRLLTLILTRMTSIETKMNATITTFTLTTLITHCTITLTTTHWLMRIVTGVTHAEGHTHTRTNIHSPLYLYIRTQHLRSPKTS
jgi:hypothetical protein